MAGFGTNTVLRNGDYSARVDGSQSVISFAKRRILE
jgi:hypothetical protein